MMSLNRRTQSGYTHFGKSVGEYHRSLILVFCFIRLYSTIPGHGKDIYTSFRRLYGWVA